MGRRIANPKDSNVYRMVDFGNKPTPKGSNVYRKNSGGIYTTPSGSRHGCVGVFYKHQIPLGLLESIEADIQKRSGGIKRVDVMKMDVADVVTTPKGSYIYSIGNVGIYTTPSGSHRSNVYFFYKHPIPSGLLESL